MKSGIQTYSVKELSELAGVSKRTIHHYDEIGLLKPAMRSEKGYRFYGKSELFRLQQIMFYRMLGYELNQIKNVLDDEDFDIIKSLRFQKTQLLKKRTNLDRLITTIDKTVSELKNKEGMITEKEMYEGFSDQKVKEILKEVDDRWGDEAKGVYDRIKAMGKTEWKDTKEEGKEISLWLSNLTHKPVSDVEVQKVILLHFQHIGKFYEVSEDRYRGLANMYLSDERFKAYYDDFKPGLAEFINKGIHVFCDNGMRVSE